MKKKSLEISGRFIDRRLRMMDFGDFQGIKTIKQLAEEFGSTKSKIVKKLNGVRIKLFDSERIVLVDHDDKIVFPNSKTKRYFKSIIHEDTIENKTHVYLDKIYAYLDLKYVEFMSIYVFKSYKPGKKYLKPGMMLFSSIFDDKVSNFGFKSFKESKEYLVDSFNKNIETDTELPSLCHNEEFNSSQEEEEQVEENDEVEQEQEQVEENAEVEQEQEQVEENAEVEKKEKKVKINQKKKKIPNKINFYTDQRYGRSKRESKKREFFGEQTFKSTLEINREKKKQKSKK